MESIPIGLLDRQRVKRAVTTDLRGIPEESVQQCIEAWQRRLEKCIRLEGNYFEGKAMYSSWLFGIEINCL